MSDKKVRSIRGEIVDFDLLKIKGKMENRDKPDSVELREKYIDIRRRRNPRRNVSDLINEQRRNEMDAREKIELSKKNKLKKEASTPKEVAAKPPEVAVSGETEDVSTPTPEVTKTRRRIVKKVKEDDDES